MLLGVALLLATMLLVGLVRAQQIGINLDEGDDVTFSCPTQLSVDFNDQGATVSCAAAPSDASDATATPDTSDEP